MTSDIKNAADWQKGDGLLPAVVQNPDNGAVLMLGYMNEDALANTLETGKVTFFSRSKQRLWTKGESSGNVLHFVDVALDCDCDTWLVTARPEGPTCHNGTITCFNDDNPAPVLFLNDLADIINQRKSDMPEGSYTTSLFSEGKSRIAQKVGEEGVELALARMKNDKEEIANEAADLLFHMLVLLADADMSLGDVLTVLKKRHANSK